MLLLFIVCRLTRKFFKDALTVCLFVVLQEVFEICEVRQVVAAWVKLMYVDTL